MKEFKELYGLHSKDLFNYLYYLTNDSSLAEELVQETFYQAFKSIHRFQGKSKVRTWLYQIAKHVYYKYLKKNPSHKSEHFDEGNGYIADYDTSETVFQKKEEEKLLHRSIMSLKEPCENWATVTFHRGKQRLQTILKKGEF